LFHPGDEAVMDRLGGVGRVGLEAAEFEDEPSEAWVDHQRPNVAAGRGVEVDVQEWAFPRADRHERAERFGRHNQLGYRRKRLSAVPRLEHTLELGPCPAVSPAV